MPQCLNAFLIAVEIKAEFFLLTFWYVKRVTSHLS